ncbi:MAG TPA: hypothetical protein DDW76_28095 [Cyanobacteria bacterium UBA11369]|nr:hypothetical protein [Cyanobacteria bacterium UBA11371]HBE36188.1 hypothetical protein [Cyanobacteria bacterium UBA11368]HBE52528.1 hypothetical protein [Cyanobacteria bacterium UBA11369]
MSQLIKDNLKLLASVSEEFVLNERESALVREGKKVKLRLLSFFYGHLDGLSGHLVGKLAGNEYSARNL